jgi:hypothetical protein
MRRACRTLHTSPRATSLGPTGGPPLLGRTSWSKMAVGMARVATALGTSTMPEMRPSQGQQERSR